jgi:hypothetical protein
MSYSMIVDNHYVSIFDIHGCGIHIEMFSGRFYGQSGSFVFVNERCRCRVKPEARIILRSNNKCVLIRKYFGPVCLGWVRKNPVSLTR